MTIQDMSDAAKTIHKKNNCISISDDEIVVAVRSLRLVLSFLEEMGEAYRFVRYALLEEKDSLINCAQAREWSNSKMDALEN
jgi:hypothetical protein